MKLPNDVEPAALLLAWQLRQAIRDAEQGDVDALLWLWGDSAGDLLSWLNLDRSHFLDRVASMLALARPGPEH